MALLPRVIGRLIDSEPYAGDRQPRAVQPVAIVRGYSSGHATMFQLTRHEALVPNMKRFQSNFGTTPEVQSYNNAAHETCLPRTNHVHTTLTLTRDTERSRYEHLKDVPCSARQFAEAEFAAQCCSRLRKGSSLSGR